MKRIPIADCPKCGRTVIYSGDPRDKHKIALGVVDENYNGKSVYCAKCKTMLAIIEIHSKEDSLHGVHIHGTISN